MGDWPKNGALVKITFATAISKNLFPSYQIVISEF